MNNIYIRQLILITLGFMLPACAQIEKYLPNQMTISEAPGHKVKLKSDAIVKTTSGEPKEEKAGSEIIVKDEPVFVEAPGYVGVVVLPAGSAPVEMDLELRQVSDWASNASKNYASKRITEILQDVSEVQGHLFVGKYDEALRKVRSLKKSYPEIAYLNFLEASTLTLMNRRGEAIPLLRKGLADHPEFEPAQELLRSIASEPGGQ